MKILISGLLGTGAMGLVFLTYLALQGQQETKQAASVQMAEVHLQRAQFDQSFDEAWAKFDGDSLSEEQIKHHTNVIAEADSVLMEEKDKLKRATIANEALLADVREAINDLE